jgi:outer membrane protein assembly factor BamC
MIRLIALLSLVLATVVSCSPGATYGNSKVRYKGSKSATPLVFPPDLKPDSLEGSYEIPAATTLSQYQQRAQGGGQLGAVPGRQQTVLPHYSHVQLMRAGSNRWIRTSMPADVAWEKIKEFWQNYGFVLEKENALAGTMETNWAENRAELVQGPVRKVLSKVMDSLYSTGTRDKYRTRLERVGGNSLDIMMTHQRMIEKLSGDNTVWTMDKPKPDLESEMLALLMAHLGGNANAVQAARQSHRGGGQTQPRARLVSLPNKTLGLDMGYGFENAWRLAGNALERTGFSVTDKNRSSGIYYVSYQDPLATGKKGRWFKKKLPPEQYYQVRVQPLSQTMSRVSVLSRQGQLLSTATSQRILTILYEQLK